MPNSPLISHSINDLWEMQQRSSSWVHWGGYGVVTSALPYSGYFSGDKIFVHMEILRVRGKNFVVTCTRVD